jgi:hypothetical protein
MEDVAIVMQMSKKDKDTIQITMVQYVMHVGSGSVLNVGTSMNMSTTTTAGDADL